MNYLCLELPKELSFVSSIVSACHQLLPSYISWTAAASNQTMFLLRLGFLHHPTDTNQPAPGADYFTSLLPCPFWRLKLGWFYFLTTLVWKAAIKKKIDAVTFAQLGRQIMPKPKIYPSLGPEYSCIWLCSLSSRNNCILLNRLNPNIIFRKQTYPQAP